MKNVGHDETCFKEEVDNLNIEANNLDIHQDKVNYDDVEISLDDDDGHSSKKEIDGQIKATLEEISFDEAIFSKAFYKSWPC